MKTLIVILIIIVILIAWYLFRPEKLVISKKVNEGFPEMEGGNGATESSPQILYTGNFQGVAHDSTGLANVYQLRNGKQILRFTDFKVSNGPDLHVYLVAVDDGNDNQTVKDAEIVTLGPIKGNVGDQNYELPNDVDLDKYRTVVIWCKRFGVNFATAPLRLS